MSGADPVNALIRAELGRATAECLRLRARLDALIADPGNPHAADERAHLESLLAMTEQRRDELETLAAGLPKDS